MSTVDPRIRALEEEIDLMRSRLDAVTSRCAELSAEPPAADVAAVRAPLGRRDLLRGGALAAAGAATGATALIATAGPAAAAPGSFSATGTAVALTATAQSGLALDASSSDTAVKGRGLVGIEGITSGTGQNRSGTAGFDFGTEVMAKVAGVYGVSVHNIGVRAASTAGTGLDAVSLTANGIEAQSRDANGIHAHSDLASGVYGTSPVRGVHGDTIAGVGVLSTASGAGYGLEVGGGRAAILVRGAALPPGARSDAHIAHELDAVAGSLWWCTAPGSPGTWRKLAGPDTAGALHVLASPIRIDDTRPGNPPLSVTKGPLAAAAPRVVDTKLAVPAGATAALVNLTVVATSPTGFVTAYRNGIPWPGTSNINWDRNGQVIANSAVVALDGNARLQLYASAATHVVVDVVGYYR